MRHKDLGIRKAWNWAQACSEKTSSVTGDHTAIETKLVSALKPATNLSGSARLVDSLPTDGIVVDDKRDCEAS